MIRRPAEMRTELREKMRGGEGTVSIRHAFAREEFSTPCRLCATLTIPPHGSIGRHEHQGEDEVYVVLRGSGLLDDGTTKSRISAGDAVLTGRGGSHAVINDTDEVLEILAVIICA